MRSEILWRDRSSDAIKKMARTSAFLAILAAKVSGKSGELRLRKICLYNDKIRPLFLIRSSVVAHTRPFAIL
ncbi:Highly reducing polyketide synthase curS1 [Bienertia sinuspersici]